MKLQDVLLKAMAKKISWMSAPEIAGITDRTMRRIRERYEKFGYTGLFDQRKGKRSTTGFRWRRRRRCCGYIRRHTST